MLTTITCIQCRKPFTYQRRATVTKRRHYCDACLSARRLESDQRHGKAQRHYAQPGGWAITDTPMSWRTG